VEAIDAGCLGERHDLLALLRKAATRTLEALWTAVGALLSAFNADECANYFANAGYGTLVVKAL
jgi:hypothetical protein